MLLHVQAHLDEDLSLERLAGVAGLSPHHFHRAFSVAVGETTKQYTDRLRLERAALHLVLHEGTILDTALDCGFDSHEVFSRAFKRRFRETPSAYRKRQLAAWSTAGADGREIAIEPQGFELSRTKPQTLARMHVAFLRHVGPYEAVDAGLFRQLTDWADARGLGGDRLLLGIANDAPGITPPDRLRFDCALRVPQPFESDVIACRTLEPARYAVTTHAGHFSTLPEAYRIAVHRVQEMKGWRLLGVPTIEIYRTTEVNAHAAMNHTEIYLPIEQT